MTSSAQERFRTNSARRARALAVAVACVVSSATCSSASSTLPAANGTLAAGTWGGDNAGMIVSDTLVHVHIGCTFGDVAGRIQVDARGQFDVAGSYLLRAYPIAVRPTLPAQFTGHLDGTIVTVMVAVDDTINKQTIVRGPVTVKFGDAPHLGPCPICKSPQSTVGHALMELIGLALPGRQRRAH
jgi:hypothetical protein